MDLVYHGAGNRCGFGPGTHRVVPAALDRGGVSQSAENGLRAGAATTAHRVGTAGLTRFAGHGGGTTAAVTHGSTHRSRHARQPGSGAGVGGNRGPAPRWIGGPDDSRPVLARRGAPRRVLGAQRRWPSWLADALAWVATLTRLVLGCTGCAGSER